MSITLDQTEKYYPSDVEELPEIGKKANYSSDEDVPLLSEPLNVNSHKNHGHGHSHEKPKRKKVDHIFCWKNPPPIAQKIWFEITLERIKIGIILLFVLSAACMFAFSHEENEELLSLTGISSAYPLLIDIDFDSERTVLEALCDIQDISDADTAYEYPVPTFVYVAVQAKNETGDWIIVEEVWAIEAQDEETRELLKDFYIQGDYEEYRWSITTNSDIPVGLTFKYRQLFEVVQYQVLIAALVLGGVYILIIFELMHRTIAAMLGSFVCLGFVAVVHGRPSFEVVINWIDFETVGLLFGMMIMVGIFSETGFFEWCAIKAYKMSKGNVWHLTLILCIFTAVVSAFLDNVTTILLMTPVTIRLCNVLDIEPQPILLALVVMSNIGGTGTAIGDPPNIIIINDPAISAHEDISFFSLSLHVGPGVVLAFIVVQIYIYFVNREKVKRNPHLGRERELEIWRLTLRRIRGDDEDQRAVRDQLEAFVGRLEQEISCQPSEEKVVDISELEEQYVIKDYPLFISSIIVLSCVIAMFFLHSWIEDIVELSLAWIAIIGAMIHLLVSGIHDVEQILEKVELGTLIFFAGLFVLMHGLDILGLIDFIGDQIYSIIVMVPEGNSRLAVAILLIIWVSAFASAFIDNIPYTTAMVPVIVSLAESDLGLPLAPLTWSLCFGTCFGGNGTLIGASANVVAVGLCEQQGYPVSFVRFFKLGFPCMIISVFTATIYMLISHVLIPWY